MEDEAWRAAVLSSRLVPLAPGYVGYCLGFHEAYQRPEPIRFLRGRYLSSSPRERPS